MALANQEARRFSHGYIGTEHILLGIVEEGSGVAAAALKDLNIDLRDVRKAVEKLIHAADTKFEAAMMPQTPLAKKVIEYAIEEARGLGHNYVGTDHLLLGLIRESDGIGGQALRGLGLMTDTVRSEIMLLTGPK